MPDEHYEHPKLAAIYDLFSAWSASRDFYLTQAGDAPQQILDLGCGTGLLCDAYAAQGHNVTGVDPSATMLAVARQKPHGQAITWVQATAQAYRSAQRFDLIIMTGHAFQVLLDDDAVHAALVTVRQHLNPNGRFVFESRNPAIDWATEWNGSYALDHQGVTINEITEVRAQVSDRISFEMRYQFPDETLVSQSELHFLPRQALEERLANAGLLVETVFGNWDATPFDPVTSHEMIFITRPIQP
ncbi:MAG: class I SAM-dependent methyltransferase [Oscillochloridaceae bacterium umkhey_bin13]